jgi:hypothetical protein
MHASVWMNLPSIKAKYDDSGLTRCCNEKIRRAGPGLGKLAMGTRGGSTPSSFPVMRGSAAGKYTRTNNFKVRAPS